VKCVCIWNPYALQTLRTQKDATSCSTRSIIPEEVIDCVVMANDSPEEGGRRQVRVPDLRPFYNVCKRLDDPKSADVTFKALGAEFSNLGGRRHEDCAARRRDSTPPRRPG
jgi:hypothetical protein